MKTNKQVTKVLRHYLLDQHCLNKFLNVPDSDFHEYKSCGSFKENKCNIPCLSKNIIFMNNYMTIQLLFMRGRRN